jgi:hypothetical protein
MEHQIRAAETRWPHLRFKRKTINEASSSCPFCHQGTDRFLLFADGGWWCRVCDAKGWVDDNDSTYSKMTPEERRLRLIEAEQRRARNEREQQARRLSALEQMHSCTDHLRYHHDIPLDKMEYWLDEGMTVDTIAAYQLGWCSRCPTDREGRSSYTIPVYDRAGNLVNIRHRLENANAGDKYRPHIAGLGAQLFNARMTFQQGERIIVCEGEKKSIILAQHNYANVGIMGQRSFKREWVEWIKPFKQRFVVLDPDAAGSARKLARIIDGRVVSLPVKADDLFVRYGGTSDDFDAFLRTARRIKTD